MAGVQQPITVDDEVVQRAIAGLLRASLSLREPFEEIGASLLTSTQHRFETETGPDGEPWPELALSTQLAPFRGKDRGTDHILRRSTQLYSAITYEATDARVAVGVNKKYAAIQQLGGEEDMAPGPAAIPPRPFLGIDADDEAEISAILLGHLAEATR